MLSFLFIFSKIFQKKFENKKNNLIDYMNGCSYNIVMKNNELIIKIEHLLKIAADQTRIKIMLSLLDDNACTCDCGAKNCSSCTCLSCMIEKCVSEIMKDTGASQSLVSHQLKVLKDADLVKTRKDRQKVYYSLKDGHIKELLNVVKEHVLEKE